MDALIQGIADGAVTILASDHAPHCAYEKEVEFDMAPFGIVGLETELGLFIDILIHKKKAIDLPRLIAMLTIEPARLLRLDRGTLSMGAPGDVTIIDPGLEWTVDAGAFQSRSANTPFQGWEPVSYTHLRNADVFGDVGKLGVDLVLIGADGGFLVLEGLDGVGGGLNVGGVGGLGL